MGTEAVRDTVGVAYDRWVEANRAVPKHSAKQVEQLYLQAMSYVWGFQDAGGEVKDSERASAFGWAYGTVAAKYAANLLPSRPPIQDAWRSWQEHGQIRDWQGNRID